MDNIVQSMQARNPRTLSISIKPSARLLSLRYLSVQADFVGRIQSSLACKLPGTLRACLEGQAGSDAGFVLAWRSPTETLLLAEAEGPFARCSEISSTADGCV